MGTSFIPRIAHLRAKIWLDLSSVPQPFKLATEICLLAIIGLDAPKEELNVLTRLRSILEETRLFHDENGYDHSDECCNQDFPFHYVAPYVGERKKK